ncbi:hypothetical protein Tco_1412934, partial [Tanacetum coccineum]
VTPDDWREQRVACTRKKDICEVGGSGWFEYGSNTVLVRASMDWICRYDVQVTPDKALMKHATDAMKESRVHDFLALWGKPSRANEGRRRKGGKSSCYH